MKLHPGSWPAISLLALGMTAAHAAPPATSAYTTDSQFTYVEDATSQSIGQVNMIVCIMHAMRPDALVNEGAYLALVDQNECDKNHRSSSSNSSGGDGAAQAASYMTATVDSTRASNTDPMVAKIWIDDDSGNGPMTIWAHLNATEAPSDANPYGGFRLDFCGKPNAGGDGSCMMNGFMQGGDGTLSYYQAETQPGRSATTALKLTSVGTTSGSGRLDAQRSEGNFSTEMIFNFAYNAGLFLRGDQCFSRDATDPATGQSVWRYGLYDATSGARIDRNSGFPIEYTNGGTTYHGYLGYWGLSLPASAQATLTNGATVEKVDYNGGSSAVRTPYTVVLSPGKLTKYTRQTRTLQQLDKIRFNTWVGDASSFYVGATSNTSYELYWDDAAGHFVVTGTQVCGNNGCQLHSLDAPQSVSAAFWTNNGIQGWSQSLGGELYIDLHGAGASPDSSVVNVVYRKSDLVYPSDFPATLYCVSNCPSVASLQAFFGGSPPTDSPFGASFNAWGQVPAGNVVTYTGDATNAQLLDGSGAAVALADLLRNQNALGLGAFATTKRFTGEEGHDRIGRGNLSTVEIGRVIAEHIKGMPSVKRIATVSPDFEFGKHFVEDFLAAIKVARPDITIVRQEWPKFGAADFTPHATALQAANADLIVSGLFSGDLINFLKAAKDFDLFTGKTKFFTSGADLVKMANIKDSIPEGSLVTVWYPFYAIDNPENTRFIEEVKKRTNTYPVGSTLVGYVSGKMLAAAIQKAKNPEDPASVAAAFDNIEFASPVGPVKVRACDNMALYNFYVGAVKKDAKLPDGIGVTDVKGYNTASYARSCDDIAKLRKK